MNKFLANWPSTNGRIFATMIAFQLTVATVLYCIINQIPLDDYEWVLGMLFATEAAFAGIDMKHFQIKRETHMEAPPARPDIEDAKAGAAPPASITSEQ